MQEEAFDLAELISGYILCKLNKEEEEKLFLLLDEDEERYKLLEEYRSAHKIQIKLDYIQKVDVDKAWQKLKNSQVSKAKPKKSIFNFFKYAAVFAVLLGCTLVYFKHSKTDPSIVPDLSKRYKNDVLPATQKAKLILANGNEIILDSATHEYSNAGGIKIASANGNLQYISTQLSTPEKKSDYNKLIVPKGGTYSIELPDGTKVVLNALSELRFPVNFNGSVRKVELTGEGYFEVAKDAKHPFKVGLNGSEIEVLGTHFNISNYGETATTTLLEGSVKVNNAKASGILIPGKQAVSNQNSISISNGDLEKAVAWKNGDFYFSNDEIQLALIEIARWYNLELVYKTKFPKVHIGGRVSRRAKLTEVLAMLNEVSNVNFSIENKQLIIK